MPVKKPGKSTPWKTHCLPLAALQTHLSTQQQQQHLLQQTPTFELISFKQLECDEDEIIGSKVTVSHSKCFMDLELFHDKKTH